MRVAPAAFGPIAGVLLTLAGSALAQEAPGPFSAHVTLTSDYVFRGLSQSLEDPAIQGGFQYRHGAGFFAGVWASSVDFPSNRQRDEPRDLELDYFAGYARELGRSWGGTIQVTRYTYPGDAPAVHYNYNELGLTLQFQDLVSGAVHVSNDLFGLGEVAIAYELTGRAPLADRLDGLAGLGFYDLDDVIGDSYTYWNLGLSYSLGRFALDVAWIDTSGSGTAIFGREVSRGRVVGSLTAHID